MKYPTTTLYRCFEDLDINLKRMAMDYHHGNLSKQQKQTLKQFIEMAEGKLEHLSTLSKDITKAMK